MSEQDNPYYRAWMREKKARQDAERLLEDKSRELFFEKKKLEESYNKVRHQQAVVVQSEKMATLGTLSAGVAHEINNPLAFVISNFDSLKQFIQIYEKHIVIPAGGEEESLSLIQQDIPDMLTDITDGLNRIKDVVSNLRTFSRTSQDELIEADVNEGIESTVKLLHNQFKRHLELEVELSPLPLCMCHPNELNQVFLNLLLNASQAVTEEMMPKVTIQSEYQKPNIIVRVIDNGCGISRENIDRVFDPFFTTKAMGEGNGMGLAIARNIVRAHHGTLKVNSEVNHGSEFEVCLPVSNE